MFIFGYSKTISTSRRVFEEMYPYMCTMVQRPIRKELQWPPLKHLKCQENWQVWDKASETCFGWCSLKISGESAMPSGPDWLSFLRDWEQRFWKGTQKLLEIDIWIFVPLFLSRWIRKWDGTANMDSQRASRKKIIYCLLSIVCYLLCIICY